MILIVTPSKRQENKLKRLQVFFTTKWFKAFALTASQAARYLYQLTADATNRFDDVAVACLLVTYLLQWLCGLYFFDNIRSGIGVVNKYGKDDHKRVVSVLRFYFHLGTILITEVLVFVLSILFNLHVYDCVGVLVWRPRSSVMSAVVTIGYWISLYLTVVFLGVLSV